MPQVVSPPQQWAEIGVESDPPGISASSWRCAVSPYVAVLSRSLGLQTMQFLRFYAYVAWLQDVSLIHILTATPPIPQELAVPDEPLHQACKAMHVAIFVKSFVFVVQGVAMYHSSICPPPPHQSRRNSQYPTSQSQSPLVAICCTPMIGDILVPFSPSISCIKL